MKEKKKTRGRSLGSKMANETRVRHSGIYSSANSTLSVEVKEEEDFPIGWQIQIIRALDRWDRQQKLNEKKKKQVWAAQQRRSQNGKAPRT